MADRALAASQLNKGIAQSRYHASRHAVTADPASIDAAFAALETAKGRLEAAIESETNESTSRERIEWLRGQVDAFEPELRALNQSVDT
ncbi:hypothetical protein [Qipengyuania gelatinilytica]|uniref:Uncharacterized protein n=1 Tax=Qipengyuania gelatinilytica TaxID=2867231 RepID=A0ABX9A5A5_9SPHN|nr:hypothetical protein [Qipengyuania gelatinilytica]QZD94987.1 hypothetical protein K3136_13070 [Qipengyuania gelatinilytica]